MKHYIFLLWLLFPLTVLAQEPFAPIGAKWYDDAGGLGLTIQPNNYVLYEAEGDTMIEGLTMSQVGPFNLYNDSGKVFLWAQDSLHLTYDFTVSAGDSVLFEIEDETQTTFINWKGVVTHDSMILVDGHMLKQITCDVIQQDSGSYKQFPYVYAERIGVMSADNSVDWRSVVPTASLGVLVPPEGWYPFPRCYQDESISYTYANYAPYNLPCDYSQPVSIDQPATEGWRVYPNPSQGQVVVAAPSEATVRTHEVQVWDAQGRMVLRRPMREETALFLTGHAPGLYVVQVRAEGRLRHSQRLVLR